MFGTLWLALASLIVSRHGLPTGPDGPVLSFLVEHRTPALTGTLRTITNLGGTLGMTIATALAASWLAWRRAAADLILVPVTKDLVGRARPAAAEQVVVLTNPAFPSGHALGSCTVIGVIAAVALARLTLRWLRIAVAVLAAAFVLAVGVSRLYLGVHWTTDVLAGWLLAAAWLSLCFATRPVWLRRWQPAERPV